MLRSAQGSGRRAVMLAVLVIGLLAGLIAMHHLSADVSGPHRTAGPGSDAESAQASGPDADALMQRDDMPGAPVPGDHTDTGLLHLCLAILTGVAIIIATMLEWRRSVTPRPRPPLRASRPMPTPRAPPPSAPARLALLCVLRT
ncbi:hypothetical protein I4I84_10755 [Pseudonocardia sp. KRD-182]|uniref:DUF6153 family protein n=1 Tax=Pseudonocardia oceani TaxID=2792013 RepID=UPI001C49F02D|nr:DUF6153 family protein [Pseudonocardia oceani]MBW0109201.1 hypothetical protein [Pseudonocardia oceani]